MKVVIDIPEILLDRIKSAKCVPDMYGSDIVNTVVCVRDATPYKERPHGEWEYLKEHITEMRDADGELNQKQTCQFILELMGVIEREGDEK